MIHGTFDFGWACVGGGNGAEAAADEGKGVDTERSGTRGGVVATDCGGCGVGCGGGGGIAATGGTGGAGGGGGVGGAMSAVFGVDAGAVVGPVVRGSATVAG